MDRRMSDVQQEDSTSFDPGIMRSETPRRDRTLDWIARGLRISFLWPARALPAGPGPWQMLFIVGALSILATLGMRLEVDGPAEFDLNSWLFGWASTGLLVCSVWWVLNWGRARAAHESPVAAWFLLFSVAATPINLVGVAIAALAVRDRMPQWWSEGTWLAWGLYGALWVWMGCIAWRTAKAVNRSARVAVGLMLCVLIVEGLNTFRLNTRYWHAPYAEDDTADPVVLRLSQEVFEKQQALLEQSLRAIKPRDGAGRQLYGLVYAPYAQDVFLRESAMVKGVLEQRFDAQGHVVRLVNHPTAAAEMPWATNKNLERSLQALSQAMDIERDVLVIYLTSHGGADYKLAANNWPLNVDSLTAEQLKSMLSKLGIRNRVIAVSACYSGGWIQPLKGDDTLIMTAADADHTSFGCGNKSELTFFGRAVFDEQLRKTLSFEDAFRAAVPVIAQREKEQHKRDGFSNPQISVGKNIGAVLDELTGGR